MNNRGFATILVALIIAGLLAVGGFVYYKAGQNQTTPQPPVQQTVQTQQNNPTYGAPMQQSANPTMPDTNKNSPTPASADSNTDSSDVDSTDSNSVEPSPTLVSTTPASGPAGTMIVLHGTFNLCGNQVPPGECTTDRANQPVFLQNGNVVSDNVNAFIGSDGSMVYQAPLSLTPGKYELAMQNCFGKGCTNYHLGWFTVTTSNTPMIPMISSISPQPISSKALPGTTITIYGNNFSTSNNYISMVGDGNTEDDGSGTGTSIPIEYQYIGQAVSVGGKTITFKLPTCSPSDYSCQGSLNGAYGSTDGIYKIAVSSTNGTSNTFSLKTQ